MKLHTYFEHLAPDPERYVTIDEDDFDGAPDAGPQLIGRGATQQESRDDFWDQRIQRDADRDIKRALKHASIWTDLIAKAFQDPARGSCAGAGAVAPARNGIAPAAGVMASSAGGRSRDFEDDKTSALRDEARAERRLYAESDESLHGVGRTFR